MTPTMLMVLAIFWGLIGIALLKVLFGIFSRKVSYLFFFPIAAAIYFGIPMLEQRAVDNLATQNEALVAEWTANQCVAPQTIRQSVFLVTNAQKRGYGTGFLLEGGIIGTNRHVANSFGEEAVFITADGAEYTQDLIHIADPKTSPDLAFYRAVNGMDGVRALPLATTAPAAGEQLLIIGQNRHRDRFYVSVVRYLGEGGSASDAPWGKLSPITAASLIPVGLVAILMSPDRVTDEGANSSPAFATHGDTASGNSGSAVVNCRGEVVGVHYAGRFIMLFAFEQVGYNVTLDGLKAELDKLPPAEAPAAEASVG